MARRARDVSERGLYALLAIVALLIIYLVAFVVSNTNDVEVSFVVFDAHASLIWVMLVCTIIGIGVGFVVSTLWHRTRSGAARATRPVGGGTGPLQPGGGSGASTSPPLRRPTDPPA